jgi:arsenate reductase
MGEIATSERQITLFYQSKSSRGKKTLAYAVAEGVPILEVDILKTPLTGTQIAELAARLEIPVSGLVNSQHAAYMGKFASKEFSENDWITILRKNPEMIRQPIALRGNKTILVETPSDIIKI